ncbi:uncharacterized protein LOC100264237 isoform X3 [Vitis vinifera]|uniref:uncharacterized protein LOC100264237 isoform X3 n=1 Tax=Vitis vinifera TaxID=29760 RepID=UPI0028830E5A|nr:uncharacterized protein LOC100264237 isoform X3 [Vitis vinifera]
MSLPSKVCLQQLKLLSHHQGFNPSIPRVPTFHKLNIFSQFHHHNRHLRFCSINGHAGVRLLACQMVMTTLPTMKTQVQRAKMVKENCTHQKSFILLQHQEGWVIWRQLKDLSKSWLWCGQAARSLNLSELEVYHAAASLNQNDN